MPLTDLNYAEILRQQESLRQVIELISGELELRPLLTSIVVHACELLGADRGTIGLYDGAREIVRIEAEFNMPPGELGSEIPSGMGLTGQVAATGEIVWIGRYGDLEEPTRNEVLDDTVIGMPIYWRNHLIGVFGIGAEPPHQFQQRDVETLAVFARHAAIAIINAQLFAETQDNLEETRLLYETSHRISTAQEVDDVIKAYLKQVAAHGEYMCSIALYEFDERGERTAVVVRWQYSPEHGLNEIEIRFPYERDALDIPLDAGEEVLITDVMTDERVPPSLREMQMGDGRPALAMIPLMVRGLRIGLVILSYPDVHFWIERNLRPYKVTAAQLATAIDGRQQQRLLLDRNRQLAVLEERQRLAYELHDSVTHVLFSLTLIAQTIAPAWRRSPEEGEQRINRILELSQLAMGEMRGLLTELRPQSPLISTQEMESYRPSLARLKEQGLPTALQRHLEEVARDGIEVQLTVEAYTRQPLELEEALYRIAQEGLNNVFKHAHADQVQISLGIAADIIYLTVHDNGIGFAGASEKKSGGLGLKTMRERAQAVGGDVQVITTPERGTTVQTAIPVRSDDNKIGGA